MHGHSIDFERFFGLRFGKVIGLLLIGRTFHDGEFFPIVGIPKPVPLGQEISRPACDLLV